MGLKAWIAVAILLMVPFVAHADDHVAAAQAGPIDCAKAASKLDRLICSDMTLPTSDKEVADLYSRLLAGASGEERVAIIEEQRAWRRNRTRECPLEAFQSEDCLRHLYIERRFDLSRRVETFVTLTCEQDRAVLAFGRRKDKPSAPDVVNNAVCVLGGGTTILVEPDGDAVRLWVNGQLVHTHSADDGKHRPARLEVGPEVIEYCDPYGKTDRKAEDGLRCAPLANTRRLGVDGPKADPAAWSRSFYGVYQRDPEFCQEFLREGRVILPDTLRPIPWEKDPSEVFADKGRDWKGAVRFKAKGADHVFLKDQWSAFVLRRLNNATEVVCRFVQEGR